MLDTIILETQGFCIPDLDKFSLNARQVLNSKARFAKCQSNPSFEDKKKGIYKPRLTLLNRAGAHILKIEFSAPKLLYGNNLDELDESQFDEVVVVLQQRLKEMGVWVWRKEIMKARVTTFHPSKNIALSGGYTATYIISELYKLDVPKYMDINKSDFRNNGHSLQFYSASNAFVVYDKIADLKKSSKRAIDQDQTFVQLNLFNQIRKQQLPLEVFRLEVRLNKGRKIKEVLSKNEYFAAPTFQTIFNERLCQSILQQYWKKYVQDRQLSVVITTGKFPQVQLANFLRQFPKARPKRAIYLVGLAAVLGDQDGVRGLRQVIDSARVTTAWQSIKDDAKQYLQTDDVSDTTGISIVEKTLKDFTPFRLPVELQCKAK